MGTWGNRNFENDSAMDFVADFIDNPSLESLEEPLTTVMSLSEEEEYIEVDEAGAALAAAEIVAAILAKPSVDFPSTLRAAIAPLHSSVSLQKLARKAVKQILKESELQELFAESGEPSDWQDVQKDLIERLK
ncbi:DUF4259 domain-containing protein [Hymenobacter sp. UV11]|uniref:DUF4259 domain-containing protein n=1 Tax=Hymenobacter sp. UV11 TaxID=1849735 RepID=UPI00105C346B|nr:DUF4259 domain-containing protein [Hymenobacter sp. UV11]TDN39251.1 hypothetical protein A8B98_18495 [Hymenobacter sp. UV11]TFZ65669.1 DUF4259 domain-containing protein [Hymenobacter sp. UV11]